MKHASATPHTSSRSNEEILSLPARFHATRWNDLPRIELYMDQLISLCNRELEALQIPGNELNVTSSMVNNYVKAGLIPSPHKKRYSSEHYSALLFVAILKTVLSLQELAELQSGLLHEFAGDYAGFHDHFCEQLEQSLFMMGMGETVDPQSSLPLSALSFALRAFAARRAAQALLYLSVLPDEKDDIPPLEINNSQTK